MSFFDQHLNKDEQVKDGTFDAQSMEPIPDKTQCQAYIDEAHWDQGNPEYDQEPHIKIRWAIQSPSEYKNRKIFQKIRIEHADETKKRKAWQMLQAIDQNCGGGIAKTTGELTDMVLQQSLMQKPMMIQVMKWEMNGRTGNWIAKVSKRGAGGPSSVPVSEPKTAPFSDDDIPF